MEQFNVSISLTALDNIDFTKPYKQVDDNTSGLKRWINEEEYLKLLHDNFDNVDIEEAEKHLNLINAIIEDIKRKFKSRESV